MDAGSIADESMESPVDIAPAEDGDGEGSRRLFDATTSGTRLRITRWLACRASSAALSMLRLPPPRVD